MALVVPSTIWGNCSEVTWSKRVPNEEVCLYLSTVVKVEGVMVTQSTSVLKMPLFSHHAANFHILDFKSSKKPPFCVVQPSVCHCKHEMVTVPARMGTYPTEEEGLTVRRQS